MYQVKEVFAASQPQSVLVTDHAMVPELPDWMYSTTPVVPRTAAGLRTEAFGAALSVTAGLGLGFGVAVTGAGGMVVVPPEHPTTIAAATTSGNRYCTRFILLLQKKRPRRIGQAR